MLPARSEPLAFGSPSLPLPSSNARHPASASARYARPVAPATAPARYARPRPPFGASKLHSLKRLQNHELIKTGGRILYHAVLQRCISG